MRVCPITMLKARPTTLNIIPSHLCLRGGRQFKVRTRISQEHHLMEKPINLLVFGRNKSGKSTLVESLLGGGQNTNEYPNDDSGAVSAKSKVCVGGTRDNRMLKMFEVPALDNIYLEKADIFKEIVKDTGGRADLMLFCIDMRRRLNQDDRNLLGHIDRAYGRSIWKNAMIVLTFGNEVGSEDNFLKERAALMKSFANCSLPGTSVTPCWTTSGILKRVPVIAVGLQSIRLPDNSVWEDCFWDVAKKIIGIGPTTLKIRCNKCLWLLLITLSAILVIGAVAGIVRMIYIVVYCSKYFCNSFFMDGQLNSTEYI